MLTSLLRPIAFGTLPAMAPVLLLILPDWLLGLWLAVLAGCLVLGIGWAWAGAGRSARRTSSSGRAASM